MIKETPIIEAGKVDGEPSFFLFRGDVGLPRGLPAISPLARQKIWLGTDPKKALEIAWSTADVSIAYEDLGEFDGMIYEYSEHNRVDNPFVSMTADFEQAVRYATLNRTDWSRGYITVAQVRKSRFDEFRRYINQGIARANSECGVHGFIDLQEIISQIPTRRIKEHSLAMRGRGNEFFLSKKDELLSAGQLLKEAASHTFSCPVCKVEMSSYLGEILGDPEGPFQICEPEDVNSSGSMNTMEDRILRSPIRKLPLEDLRLINQTGQIARCAHCRSFFYNPSVAAERRVEIRKFKKRIRGLVFQVANLSRYTIEGLRIAIEYRVSGRAQFALVTRNLWSPPDIRLPEPLYKLARALSDSRIAPQSKVTHKMPAALLKSSLPDSVDWRESVCGLRIYMVYFADGRNCFPLEPE